MKNGIIFGIGGAVIVGIIIVLVLAMGGKSISDNENENNSQNQTLADEFSRQREWIRSGPFEIDRSYYYLGENVFIRISGLQPEEVGEIKFLRPINATHKKVYTTMEFDGSKKPDFNQYFRPDIIGVRGICSGNDLIGVWEVVFSGTSYSPLGFVILNKTLPGEEDYHKPVC